MDEVKITSLLLKLADAFNEYSRSVAAKMDMHPIALAILMFLAEHPELDTAKDICKYRFFKANTISFHVDRLVSEGYLERKQSDGDRRTIRLECTKKAQAVIENGREAQHKFAADLKRGISAEDIERLNAIFLIIDGNLSRMEARGI